MLKIFLMILFTALSISAQEKQICVDQSFVDDATKAFELVVEQRKTIETFLTERAKTDIERQSMNALLKSYDELIKVKDSISAEKDKIIAFYAKVVEMQMTIIEQLEKKLTKPKSFLDKVLKVLKEVALIVGGILIGRSGI